MSQVPAKTPDDSREWDPLDELIVTLLSEGWSHSRVAEFCSISTKTIWRRMQNPEFSEEVSRRKRERLTDLAIRLRRAGDSAIDALAEALGSVDVRVRLRAAQLILDQGLRIHRASIFESDVEERVARVERGLQESGGLDEYEEADGAGEIDAADEEDAK